MSERAFLDAIIAEPDEDAHRLVFADWLDERGQSDRAEFIRTQCALARMPDDDPRRTDLEVRERRLLAANACEWADPWTPFVNHEYAGEWPWRARFRRGFLEAIELPALYQRAGNVGEAFRQLLAAHPIRDVAAHPSRDVNGVWPALAIREELRRIESLSGWQGYRGPQDDPQTLRLGQEMDALLRSSQLKDLRRFMLGLWNVSAELAATWHELPVFTRLEAIHDPTRHPADGRFLLALVRGKFPNLVELSMPASNLESFAQAAEELVRSELWSRLRTLALPISQTFPWTDALARGHLRRLCVYRGIEQPWTPLSVALTSCRSYTFPLMLCHLGAFLGRPLMRASNLPRTVWK